MPNESSARECAGCGGSLATLAPGSLIASRYEVLRSLGKGGMGTVYQARDRMLDEVVAVKVIRSELARGTEMDLRFRSEIKLARKVTHRNVCRIHEYGEDGQLRYISMEFVEGTDLRQLLRRQGPPPPEQAYRWAMQTAEGLEAIHEVGVIHRDLKTANIMRDPQRAAKIMDFGIAKEWSEDLRSGLTATGQIIGTPEYMSPEQIRGEKVDFRSDLYSLGIVIYELFTGAVPFSADTPMGTILKHLQEPPPLEVGAAARMPEAVRGVVRKALAKDRAERYPSAAVMLSGLREAWGPPTLAPPLPVTAPAPTPPPVATVREARPPEAAAEAAIPRPVTRPRPELLRADEAAPAAVERPLPAREEEAGRRRARLWRLGAAAALLLLTLGGIKLLVPPGPPPASPSPSPQVAESPAKTAAQSLAPEIALPEERRQVDGAPAQPARGPSTTERPAGVLRQPSSSVVSPRPERVAMATETAAPPSPVPDPARGPTGGDASGMRLAATSFVAGESAVHLAPEAAHPPGMGEAPPGLVIKPAEAPGAKAKVVIEIEPQRLSRGDHYVLRYFIDNGSSEPLRIAEALVLESTGGAAARGGRVEPLTRMAQPDTRTLLFESQGSWPHPRGTRWKTTLRVAMLDGSVYEATLQARE